MISRTPVLALPTSSAVHPCSVFQRCKHPWANRRIPATPYNSRRNFVSNPLTPLQTLTATRILPYHSSDIFNLIADISSYPQFIPYCTSSTITSSSAPDPETSRTWPRTADLQIGYGPYDELFRSAVYCLPNTVLEAVAGDAECTIPRGQLPHYFDSASATSHDPEKSSGNSIFTSLLTRWSLREFPFKPAPPDGTTPQEGEAEQKPASPRTEVNLLIEVRFASAVYSALSQAVAPKVAGMMVEAFEKRAREVLGEGHGVEDQKLNKQGQPSEGESAKDAVRRGVNQP